jgi:hypothetical protein
VSKGVLIAEDILSVPAALEAAEKTVDEIKDDGMEVTNIRHVSLYPSETVGLFSTWSRAD